MPELIIIGNSGAARECHSLALSVMWANPTAYRSLTIKGFLSHRGYAGDLREHGHLLLGSDEDHIPAPEERFIIGIGDPEIRRDAFELMKSKGGKFFNLISPWAGLAPDTTLGEGNVIGHGCVTSVNVTIGTGNYLNGHVKLAHDCVVGDFNFFAPDVLMLGAAKVGSLNRVGARSILVEKSKVGDGNLIAPASVLYKGCKNNCRMLGNPALRIGDADDI